MVLKNELILPKCIQTQNKQKIYTLYTRYKMQTENFFKDTTLRAAFRQMSTDFKFLIMLLGRTAGPKPAFIFFLEKANLMTSREDVQRVNKIRDNADNECPMNHILQDLVHSKYGDMKLQEFLDLVVEYNNANSDQKSQVAIGDAIETWTTKVITKQEEKIKKQKNVVGLATEMCDVLATLGVKGEKRDNVIDLLEKNDIYSTDDLSLFEYSDLTEMGISAGVAKKIERFFSKSK